MTKKTQKIGKYEILSKIAVGGMGVVYKAKHPTLDRFVLLKKLTLRGSSSFVERFKREARIMMDFKHDHIVHVYDHFKEGSSYYIAEEFVDGLSLDNLIKKERYLSNEAAMLIFYEACKALKYAHDKNVIHRDIKPANILISRQGEVKLVDFGIATSKEDSEEGLTREGMTLGTPSYIAPEQIQDSKNVDKRADIYSLGVMLYEMLTGKTPFPGTFTAEVIALIHKGKYKSPHKLNPRISPVLRKIIKKSMKAGRNRRYRDLKGIIKILAKRIKKKDPASIRHAVKRVLQGKEIKDIYRKKISWLKILVETVLVLCLLGGASFYIYQQGYYYEYLKANNYGALIISARIKNSYKNPEDIFIHGILYRDKTDDLIRLEDLNLNFGENKQKRDDTYFYLESRKVYLESGKYRLKINIEGELFWESFFLNPREVQKRNIESASARLLGFNLMPAAHLPLRIDYTVYNIDTREDITKGTAFYLLRKNKWVRWSNITAGEVRTGNVHQFKFEKDGFYPQHYNLIIEPYQNNLHLKANLVPYPGTLVISSNTEGLKALLNNSEYYFSAGGKDRTYSKLEPLGSDPWEISLPPGEYLLTVEGMESVSRSARIKIDSRGTTSIRVEFNEKEKSMHINFKE